MLEIIALACDEWATLRDIRLAALHDSPGAFLATHEREMEFGEDQWRAEFIRGDWYVGRMDDRAVSLLGITRTADTPADQCYLEYLWVAPEHRRSGIASRMLGIVLTLLQAAGLSTAFLYVLDGNESAQQLYKRVGFVSTNHRQRLPGQNRSEELLQLDLSQNLAD